MIHEHRTKNKHCWREKRGKEVQEEGKEDGGKKGGRIVGKEGLDR